MARWSAYSRYTKARSAVERRERGDIGPAKVHVASGFFRVAREEDKDKLPVAFAAREASMQKQGRHLYWRLLQSPPA